MICAQAEARAKEANKSREAADERIARLNSAIGKEEDGHAAEEVAFASLAARQRAVSTAANDCRARGDALRAQLEATTEERDEYQNNVIKLEQQLKEAKEERDAATKAAGVIQAKLDAANEEIEKNGVILCGNQIYGAFVLNLRVDLHAIDATPARWRGDAGSSPLDGASTG